MSGLVPVRVPAYAATASHSYFHVLSVLMHVLFVCVCIYRLYAATTAGLYLE